MKKQITIAVAAFFAATTLWAQNTVKDEIALIQKAWGLEKKVVIGQYMQFTDAEAAAFWPVYDEYQAKRAPMINAWLTAIADYAENYTTMTNEKATAITNVVLKSQVDREKLRSSYYKKFSKAVSPMRATQYYQIETHMETAIRYELQMSIPFVGEMKFEPAK